MLLGTRQGHGELSAGHRLKFVRPLDYSFDEATDRFSGRVSLQRYRGRLKFHLLKDKTIELTRAQNAKVMLIEDAS